MYFIFPSLLQFVLQSYEPKTTCVLFLHINFSVIVMFKLFDFYPVFLGQAPSNGGTAYVNICQLFVYNI